MKNEKWTTNDFKQEKSAIENLKEKIVKCSEAVLRYLAAVPCIFYWEMPEAFVQSVFFLTTLQTWGLQLH